MRAQSNVISIVIIAGIIVALVGAAYVWAVPLIEKGVTVTDYDVIERFVLDTDKEIVKIANTGSGVLKLEIPKGSMTLNPYSFSGNVNNTLTLDFVVSQPIVMEGGSIPVETGNLEYVGEYGTTEPRIMMLNRYPDTDKVHLNMTVFYREMRSDSPKGYIIALCPVSDFENCQTPISGSRYITMSYGETFVVPRSPADGGDITVTKIRVDMG